MSEALRVADMFSEIKKNLERIRLEEPLDRMPNRCAIQDQTNITECWCYNMNPTGGHLPCPAKIKESSDVYC